VKDANGVVLATVHCRDDLQKRSFGHSRLSSEEARKIANAISRIPEFMMQRRGFYSRGQGNYRWKPARPYHVAFEDGYRPRTKPATSDCPPADSVAVTDPRC
jgi:hypothetical protein